MATYGYARVSSRDQNLRAQEHALKAAGVEVIRAEKVSGRRRERPELETLLDFIREGDTLVVTRLDRLGRSIKDLVNICDELKERGVALKVIEQPVDTSTSSGRAFFGMLAVFAQFEADIRAERQAEGIAEAKAKGKYKGGKARINTKQVIAMHDDGVMPTAIAKKLGIARSSVYRALAQGAA